jgi:hypothetical protein
MPHHIKEAEVKNAQAQWANALVEIGQLAHDWQRARDLAEIHIKNLYDFSRPLLFKPTRASKAPFRHCFPSCLSYFVGQNPEFPEDTGFALVPWSRVVFDQPHLAERGDVAVAMGHYRFVNREHPIGLKVEYTFGYHRNADKEIKIFLHHSSLPYPHA